MNYPTIIEMTGNKAITRKAKVLLLQILKQGYITPQQIKDLASTIDLPMLQIEVIDKTGAIK